MHESKSIHQLPLSTPGESYISGLIPADDAPDIVANTFLATLSDETLKKIRYGFLEHRERKWNFISNNFEIQASEPPNSQINC
jgi:hypothetical protein